MGVKEFVNPHRFNAERASIAWRCASDNLGEVLMADDDAMDSNSCLRVAEEIRGAASQALGAVQRALTAAAAYEAAAFVLQGHASPIAPEALPSPGPRTAERKLTSAQRRR